MSVLDRLSPWTTTGVGSLPFDDPKEAAEYATSAYGLPFCPQLPRLEGDMITEWLGADPGRCGWSPERDRERPRASDDWLEELGRRPPPHRMVKLQVTGPATLACALERSAGQRASRREAIALARELAQWLAANASVQVGRLREMGLATVLVVDEPALEVFGTEGIEQVWGPLRQPASVWGLHFCCHVPWQIVERAEPDLLSFDLSLDPIDQPAAGTLRRHLGRNGWIAWGAIPVGGGHHFPEAQRRLEAALGALGADTDRSLVTASCGTGRVSAGREREIALDLSVLGREMTTARSPASA
jgi:hypothetical protein